MSYEVSNFATVCAATAQSETAGETALLVKEQLAKELLINLTAMKRLLGQKWDESAKEYKTILLAVMAASGDANPIACALPMAKEMSERGHSPLMLLAVATEMSEASND